MAMFSARLTQELTRLAFHQLDCSLVGCSFTHPALQQNSLDGLQCIEVMHYSRLGQWVMLSVSTKAFPIERFAFTTFIKVFILAGQ